MSESTARPRNYRILRISSRGSAAAEEQLYRDNPRLRCASFAEQRRVWLAEKIGHADSLSRAMKSMGHDAGEIIADAEIMQRTWALERGLDLCEKDWRMQVLLAQLAECKPEIVYLQNYDVLSRKTLRNLKSLVPSISLLVIHQQSVVATTGVLRELATADVLLVSSSLLFRECRDAGLAPQLVYSSFDPSILSQLPARSQVSLLPFHEFTFLAGANASGDSQRQRTQLDLLLRRSSLEIWSADRADFEDTVDTNRLHDPVFGLDAFKVLQRSKITLDCLRDATSGGGDNPRLFEATGVGACLLSERGGDLDRLFSDGTEVVTYGCAEECVENVAYLLSHERERIEIAEAGRQRTLAEHASRKRYSQVDAILQAALSQRRRGRRSRWSGMLSSAGA